MLLFQIVTEFRAVDYNPKAISLANCIDTDDYVKNVGAVSVIVLI
jgi:hypothetical protein